ncbi:MAG TPA: Hpt domain-containing protein [Abditibacterium sp.]|jgi:HPt (histidine-containing phosphotransfer) domain-containing protein
MDDHLRKPIKQAELALALTHWASEVESAGEIPAPEAEIAPKEPVLQRDQWNELQSELDADLLEDLVRIFLAEAPQLIADLERAASAEDRVGLREIAHKMKGSCATMGVARLASLCRAIETAASDGDGDFTLISAHLARLAPEFGAAQAELEKYLSEPRD